MVTALQTAESLLNITGTDFASRLQVLEVLSKSHAWGFTNMNQERYNAMKDYQKQAIESATGLIIVFYWNNGESIGLLSESDGFTKETRAIELPQMVKEILQPHVRTQYVY